MFITFEGIEGSSKTTQAGLLNDWLVESHKIDCLLTKEPGSILSKECQDIRKILLDPNNDIDPTAELFLYLSDRAQHVGNYIIPAINNKKWVISDRYTFSTMAYQGYGRGKLSEMGSWFTEALDLAAHNMMPDIAFIMDLPVEVGLSRARSSNVEFVGGDRMEREAIDFHQRLRDGFLDIAKQHSDICVVLNAEKSIDELHEEVKKTIERYL